MSTAAVSLNSVSCPHTVCPLLHCEREHLLSVTSASGTDQSFCENVIRSDLTFEVVTSAQLYAALPSPIPCAGGRPITTQITSPGVTWTDPSAVTALQEADGVIRALRHLNGLDVDGQELLVKCSAATQQYADEYLARKVGD